MDRNAEALGNSLTILGVNFVEKLDHLLLNIFSNTGEGTSQVLDQVSSVSLIHHLSEEGSWLLEISVGVLVSISGCFSANSEGNLLLGGILNWTILGVGLIVRSTSLVSIDGGEAISLIVGNSYSVWAVDRDLVIVSTKSMSVGVRVGEKSALEHLISRDFNTWDDVGGCESTLLNLSKIVFGVSVQSELSNGDQRVVAVRNNLGDIEDIKLVCLSCLLGDKLNVPGP